MTTGNAVVHETTSPTEFISAGTALRKLPPANDISSSCRLRSKSRQHPKLRQTARYNCQVKNSCAPWLSRTNVKLASYGYGQLQFPRTVKCSAELSPSRAHILMKLSAMLGLQTVDLGAVISLFSAHLS